MQRLAVIATMLATFACKKTVDTADFETRIKKRTEELGLATTKVSCPKEIEAKVGASFSCNVEIGGKPYEIVATITKINNTDIDMDTAWKNGDAVISAKLEKPLADELGQSFATKVTITCGDALRFLDKERKIRCDLTAGATKAKVAITFDAELVPTDWELEPPLLAKAKVEAMLTPSVREKTSPGATVTCGSEPLVMRPADGILYCDFADGDKKARVKVPVSESLEIRDWEIVQ